MATAAGWFAGSSCRLLRFPAGEPCPAELALPIDIAVMGGGFGNIGVGTLAALVHGINGINGIPPILFHTLSPCLCASVFTFPAWLK